MRTPQIPSPNKPAAGNAGIASRLTIGRQGPGVPEQYPFGVKTVLPIVLAFLLVSCGRSPDPPFMSRTGDLDAFLLGAISSGHAQLASSNHLTASWSSRVLTHEHQSGEYLDGRQALQVATAKTSFAWMDSFLTHELGAPTMPVREEDGWRHVGWSRSDPKVGVWLIEDKDQCRIEIVTESTRGKP